MCVSFWFWFCFLNNNIYNVPSGSFVFSVCLHWGWLGLDRCPHGQQGALVPHGRPASLCVAGAHLARFSFSRLPHSPPPSVAALPSLLSIPVARVSLKGQLSPAATLRKRRQSQAWYFKPLLTEGKSGVYVQERRKWYMYKKEWAPVFPPRGREETGRGRRK